LYKNHLDLRNKKILVVGSSKGLGKSLSIELAKINARIAMLSRSVDNLDRIKKKLKNPSKHLVHHIDLENTQSINKAIDFVIKKFNHLDVIYHVAGGGYGFKEPLIENQKLLKLFKVNVAGAAEINKIVIKKKNKKKITRIIHIGSISSYEATGSVGYNAVKSSLAGYVRSLGREMYKQNTIITGVMPGGFEAPENAMIRLKNKNKLAYTNFIKQRLPRKKMGNVKEILPLLMLLGTNFSDMMGGCMVPIDGGEGKSYII